MNYLVWNDNFDGYFVSYRDKGSDNYSKKWFDAKKYKTIVPALSRLGISYNKHIKSLESFYELNEINTSSKRDKLLSELLKEEETLKLDFKRGRIDKINDDGDFLGDASDEILNFINILIEKNIKSYNEYQEKVNQLGAVLYEQPKQIDENSWEGFY